MASKQRRTRKSQAVSTHLQHPPQTTQAMNIIYLENTVTGRLVPFYNEDEVATFISELPDYLQDQWVRTN